MRIAFRNSSPFEQWILTYCMVTGYGNFSSGFCRYKSKNVLTFEGKSSWLFIKMLPDIIRLEVYNSTSMKSDLSYFQFSSEALNNEHIESANIFWPHVLFMILPNEYCISIT